MTCVYPLLINVEESQWVSAGFCECLSGVVCVDGFVLGAVEEHISHAQHGTHG